MISKSPFRSMMAGLNGPIGIPSLSNDVGVASAGPWSDVITNPDPNSGAGGHEDGTSLSGVARPMGVWEAQILTKSSHRAGEASFMISTKAMLYCG